MKLLVVAGARPNFVKIAPLFWGFKKSKRIVPVLVHTGQHYDYEMSQVFFRDLEIPEPKYNLGIGSASHAAQTAQAMIELEKVMVEEAPDMVMVIGDVNSTVAAALAAAKLHIPVAHIEAGPRSYDRRMPEEVNRVLTDHLSDLLFCPTRSSVENLRKEGITKGVHFTGDTMYDAFLKALEAAEKREKKILAELDLEPKDYILLTLHRPANVDDPEKLKGILEAVAAAGEKIVFPVHPRTKKNLERIIKNYGTAGNISLVEPLGYTKIVAVEKNAKKICTDSGGIQKEAYWLKVPCITMLDSRGWVETFEDGWNVLVGSDGKKITKAVKSFDPKGRQHPHFGKGDAAKRIIDIIRRL